MYKLFTKKKNNRYYTVIRYLTRLTPISSCRWHEYTSNWTIMAGVNGGVWFSSGRINSGK